MSIEEELKSKGIVSQLFFISDTIYQIENPPLEPSSRIRDHYSIRTETLDNIKKIRILASRYGADAILVLKPRPIIKSDSNLLSLFYLTIIGIWIAPGTKRDISFILEGTLWDVRNEFLYLTTESESGKSVTRPLGWINDSDLVKETKELAIIEFKAEILKRFKSMK